MLPLFSTFQEACLIAKEQRTSGYQCKSHPESTGKIEHIAKKGADGKKGESHDYRYDIHKSQRLGRANAAFEIFGCSNRQPPNENIKKECVPPLVRLTGEGVKSEAEKNEKKSEQHGKEALNDIFDRYDMKNIFIDRFRRRSLSRSSSLFTMIK